MVYGFYWYMFAVVMFSAVLLYLIKRKRRLSELVKMAGVVLLLTACFALVLNIRYVSLEQKESRMPYRQPYTCWAADDGSITIDVSGRTSGTAPIFDYNMQVVIDGETYSADIGTFSAQDGLPMTIWLDRDEGKSDVQLSFSYSMPSDSELVLRPDLFRSREGLEEDMMKALMNGRWKITVHRLDGEN